MRDGAGGNLSDGKEAMNILRAVGVVTIVGIAVMGVGSRAEAHAYLKAATPAVGASGPAPKRIVLTMSEKVFPKFSGFELSSKLGTVPIKIVTANDQMIGTPLKPLPPGAYDVKWHAVGSDTHRMEGSFAFVVR
jgi:copper resistance protein C